MQGFQLCLQILQFDDACSDVCDVFVEQYMGRAAALLRKVAEAQLLPDLIQGHIQ